MGGTSFMFHLEVEKGRFSKIEEEPHGFLLSILVKEKNQLVFKLVTSLYDEEKNEISLWGEDEKFSKEEIEYFNKFAKENKIIEEAENIKKQIKENYKKSEELHDEIKKIRKEREEIRKKYNIEEPNISNEELFSMIDKILSGEKEEETEKERLRIEKKEAKEKAKLEKKKSAETLLIEDKKENIEATGVPEENSSVAESENDKETDIIVEEHKEDSLEESNIVEVTPEKTTKARKPRLSRKKKGEEESASLQILSKMS